ncbi:MAG TPA: hypothetical protein VH088_11645 [Terriglobales bacterium]|jgi:hypothetical protein|nr:hypothetical protein [Terriglobales bacterium]
MGDVINSAVNTVSNLGKAVGDAVHGDFGGALGDLGKAGGSLAQTAVGGFMAMNPELGAVTGLAGQLGNLLGKAGGFNPGQAGGLPLPFGLGNILGSIMQNPLASLFGGAGAGGAGGAGSAGGIGGNFGGGFGGFPGLGGLGFPGIGTGGGTSGGGGSAAASGTGGQSFAQLSDALKNAGDPASQEKAMEGLQKYQEAVTMAATIAKLQHDMTMSIIGKIA